MNFADILTAGMQNVALYSFFASTIIVYIFSVVGWKCPQIIYTAPDYMHILIPGTCEQVALYGQKDTADVIKLRMLR